MKIERTINIEDLRRMAKRRLPRLVFDYLEGGVEDETCLERNRAAFDRYCLAPRYLVDITRRDQSVELFGRTYSSPFGIGPTGMAGFIRRGGDEMLAAAAARANIPFVLSGSSNASIEVAADIAPQHAWYQLYAARDPKIAHDMVRRAHDRGLQTLVLTVDVPVRPKRERDIRHGYAMPPRPRPISLLNMLLHPSWLATIARYGIPTFGTWSNYAAPGASAVDIGMLLTEQFPATQTWKDLEALRRLWSRTLVVKGILRADDAQRAVDAGADGIIVSNHGGRQLDCAPASITVLPAIHDAVGKRIVLMLDGGVRRGADVLKAWVLGARFVFVGRATLYGVAAGGLAGATRAIDILREEIDLVMGQIGCDNLAQLDRSFLACE